MQVVVERLNQILGERGSWVQAILSLPVGVLDTRLMLLGCAAYWPAPRFSDLVELLSEVGRRLHKQDMQKLIAWLSQVHALVNNTVIATETGKQYALEHYLGANQAESELALRQQIKRLVWVHVAEVVPDTMQQQLQSWLQQPKPQPHVTPSINTTPAQSQITHEVVIALVQDGCWRILHTPGLEGADKAGLLIAAVRLTPARLQFWMGKWWRWYGPTLLEALVNLKHINDLVWNESIAQGRSEGPIYEVLAASHLSRDMAPLTQLLQETVQQFLLEALPGAVEYFIEDVEVLLCGHYCYHENHPGWLNHLAFKLPFSTVVDALGIAPDDGLGDAVLFKVLKQECDQAVEREPEFIEYLQRAAAILEEEVHDETLAVSLYRLFKILCLNIPAATSFVVILLATADRLIVVDAATPTEALLQAYAIVKTSLSQLTLDDFNMIHALWLRSERALLDLDQDLLDDSDSA